MAKTKVTPEANREYTEWVNQEVDGRFRGERFPAGACCAKCGCRPTIAGSIFCGRCFDTIDAVPCAISGSCHECGHPTKINLGQVPAVGRCSNPACPEIIRGIYIRVLLVALVAAALAVAVLAFLYW